MRKMMPITMSNTISGERTRLLFRKAVLSADRISDTSGVMLQSSTRAFRRPMVPLCAEMDCTSFRISWL
jgi:hypothetical protein